MFILGSFLYSLNMIEFCYNSLCISFYKKYFNFKKGEENETNNKKYYQGNLVEGPPFHSCNFVPVQHPKKSDVKSYFR